MASGETLIFRSSHLSSHHRMLTLYLNSNPFAYQPWRDRRTFEVSHFSIALTLSALLTASLGHV